MKVISFSIFKGGTGKTTSTVSTAAALTKKGKRVLLVDLDQQASATRYLDLDPDGSPSLYDVFTGAKSAQATIRKTTFGIDVLPSHILLAAIEEALEPGDEQKVAGVLTPLKQEYDFILIDTPPGKAMLAFNGLAAADLIVIPASAERMAVDGVADLITHVQKIMWSKFALTHQELRILFTMYRATTSHSPAVVENARKIWRDNVLKVTIPHATLFSRSYDEKTPSGLCRLPGIAGRGGVGGRAGATPSAEPAARPSGGDRTHISHVRLVPFLDIRGNQGNKAVSTDECHPRCKPMVSARATRAILAVIAG